MNEQLTHLAAVLDSAEVVENLIRSNEALDRCHVILCILDDHLLTHLYVQSDIEVLKEVEAASEHLRKAYQLIGGFVYKE